ncbi:ferric siderophore receptor [Pectobacterium araliae]|nr:ferric siderophore receptor [Pectobacterium carotovorum subsp. carotovorum]
MMNKHRLKTVPKVVAVLIALLSPIGTYAATGDIYTYSLAKAPLAETLLSIARQSRENISFEPDLVKGYTSRSVQGPLTVEQAIAIVLEGTDLQFTRTNNGTLTIIRKPVLPAKVEESQLPPIEVRARQERGYAADSASTATRGIDTPILELSKSVSTVSAELIKDQQSPSVLDALQNVSGVTTSQATVGPSSSVRIRGFDAYNDVITDGLQSSGGRFALNTPLIGIDKIEVVKGPEAVIGGGAGKFGGVINLVSKKPQATAWRELSTVVDSSGKTSLGLDLTGALTEDEKLRGRIIGLTENHGDTDRDWDGGKNKYLAPSLAWKDTVNDLLIGAELQNETRPFGNYAYTPSNSLNDLVTVPHAKDDGFDYKSRRYYINYKRYFSQDWEFTTQAQYASYLSEMNAWLASPNPLNSPTSIFAQANQNGLNYRSKSFSTSLGKYVELGATTHNLLLGFDFIDSESRQDIRGVFNDASTPFLLLPVGQNIILPSVKSLPYGIDYLSDSRSRTIENSYYFQDQFSIADDWHFLLSARRITYRPVGDSTIESLTKWLYGGGIVYQLTPAFSTYASYSEGVTNSFQYATRDGSGLPPTQAKQYEIGTKYGLDNAKVVLTTALYRLEKKNVPKQDPLDPNFYFASSGQVSRGLEVELKGKPTDKLNVSLTYNNILAEDDDGLRIGDEPRHHANLWTTYHLTDNWSVGGGIDARSKTSYSSQSIGEFKFPGQTRLDAMVRYEARQWSATLGVRNLTNRDLYDGGSSPYYLYQEPERTFTLSGSMKF